MSAAERQLVDAVALALSEHLFAREWTVDSLARVAVTSVHEHEVCAGCGCKLKPPALCVQCGLLERSSEQED